MLVVFETSRGKNSTASLSAASCPLIVSLALRMTRSPSCLSVLAVSYPRPRLAPVISTVCGDFVVIVVLL